MSGLVPSGGWNLQRGPRNLHFRWLHRSWPTLAAVFALGVPLGLIPMPVGWRPSQGSSSSGEPRYPHPVIRLPDPHPVRMNQTVTVPFA